MMSNIKKQSSEVRPSKNPSWSSSSKPILEYSEVLAESLILYAKEDPLFARELKSKISTLPLFQSDENLLSLPYIIQDFDLLRPADATLAHRRAEWLIEGINQNTLPGAFRARQILVTWNRDSSMISVIPKQIVVGIIVVAIPGITMGKFKRRVSIKIVIREDLAKSITADLTKKIIQASNGFLVKNLASAGGNIKKLEPDIADWLLGDNASHLYSATPNSIGLIANELESMNIPHFVVSDEKGTAVMAISPAVSEAAAELNGVIELV